MLIILGDSMGDSIIFDVDLASAFKSLIANNDDVAYDSNSLKSKIINAKDDDFLLVKRKIGSAITILSVDYIDDAFLKKNLP